MIIRTAKIKKSAKYLTDFFKRFLGLVLILSQEWIAVSGSRNEGVLDGAWAGPADEVPQTAGLVVGAAGAGATEGLHADHSTRGLVVYVVVAGCMAKLVVGNLLSLQAVAEEGTGEGVR